MKEARIKVDHIELQVREYPKRGEAIIFLHFGGANLMMWSRVLPFFQDRYHLVFVDLRGHGKSDKPESGYHMDDMAGDIDGLFSPLGIEQAHVIGSSMGAEVGLSLAVHFPGRVSSLVCDGALCSEYGPYSLWDGTKAEFQDHVTYELERIRNSSEAYFPSEDELVEANRKSLAPLEWWNETVEAMVRYGVIKLAENKFVKSFRNSARLDYMRHYFQARFESYYSRAACPLLLLPGEQAWENSRERQVMEGFCKLAKNARIAPVPAWIHPYGWLLQPEGVCREILIFLESQGQ